MSSNILPHLKQTFAPSIWIFDKGEGNGLKFRLPFKIFSTLRIGQLGPWSPLEQQTEEFLQGFTMKGVIRKI